MEFEEFSKEIKRDTICKLILNADKIRDKNTGTVLDKIVSVDFYKGTVVETEHGKIYRAENIQYYSWGQWKDLPTWEEAGRVNYIDGGK